MLPGRPTKPRAPSHPTTSSGRPEELFAPAKMPIARRARADKKAECRRAAGGSGEVRSSAELARSAPSAPPPDATGDSLDPQQPANGWAYPVAQEDPE